MPLEFYLEYLYRTCCESLDDRSKAVEMLFSDMAGRHKSRSDEIRIISVEKLSLEDLKRDRVIEFAGDKVEYPVFKKELNCRDTFVPQNTNIFD